MATDLAVRWKVWQECLEGEDTNSIFNQITLMTFDAAIFRLILESRRIQLKKDSENPRLNSHLHNFIDRNFFQSQVSYIRRLIEPGERSSLDGKKGVFSLSTLIKDMASMRTHITRETYFNLRKLPYNYQEIIQRQNVFSAEQLKKGITAFFVPPEYNWENSAETHALFDRLSKTNQRCLSDVIHEWVYSKLAEKLGAFQIVTRYVDKYIAHAATPDSRQADNVDEETVTWNHLWDAHRSLYEIAEFIALILSGAEHVPLVWKSPTMFEHWDEPLVSASEITQLELAWEMFQDETEDWRLSGINRIWKDLDTQNV